MSVRDPGYDPRRAHPRSGAHPLGAPGGRSWSQPGGRGSRPGSRGERRGRGGSWWAGAGGWRAGATGGALAVIAVALLIAVAFGGGISGSSGGSGVAGPGGDGGSPSAQAGPPGASPGTAAPPSPTESAASGDPAPPPDDAPPAAPAADVAIVPVTTFRSALTSAIPADVEGIASGGSPFRALVLVEDETDAILAALGTTRGELGKRLVTVESAAALAEDLADHRKRLGFLRADDVGPAVRALAWDGRSLFGVDRVEGLARWPLTARLAAPSPPAYDPADAWTLVAGGDILLDRGVKLAIDAAKAKANFPFNGGTVEITGMCRDCSPMGWDLPYTQKTGNRGAVRDLFSGADLSIANFENPAPNNPIWHGSGTVFNADPDLVDGLVAAGLDWVSLANNHIGDAGRAGMLQTIKNLDRRGLAHGGLGKNLEAAHEATLLRAGDITVGFLGYDMIAPVYHAGDDLPGSARMTKKDLRADIKAARAAGADVVVVFPHWGIEYRASPTETQRRMARAAINAGADLVIGNHPHWAQAMEVYKGKPIWYALGNFVFDQTWSDYTMEGITLELTFRGAELVQIRMRPHLILDRAQPNFMDPAGAGGSFVMNQVWAASEGLLPW